MDSGEANVIAVTVTMFTQFIKWAGLPDKWGAVSVMVLSAISVAVWGYSAPPMTPWAYVVTGTNVMLTAAGVFGFTRAGQAAVSSFKPPPTGGAGQSPTVKLQDEPS